jgi:hypothetical protein
VKKWCSSQKVRLGAYRYTYLSLFETFGRDCHRILFGAKAGFIQFIKADAAVIIIQGVKGTLLCLTRMLKQSIVFRHFDFVSFISIFLKFGSFGNQGVVWVNEAKVAFFFLLEQTLGKSFVIYFLIVHV